MQLIKERCGRVGIIRTNTYSRDLDYFVYLFEEAKKDFPNLSFYDVAIVHFGGVRYKGTWGIEFTVDLLNPVLEKYKTKDYLENLL